MARIVRQLLAVFAICSVVVVGAFAWAPSPASAQGLDLCDLLGDPYCPDGGDGGASGAVTSAPTTVTPGQTSNCVIDDVGAGSSVTATFFSDPVVVFQGEATGAAFGFGFATPNNAALGAHELEVTYQLANGDTVTRTVDYRVVSSSLARTGSDIGPMVGIGGGLVAIGFAAALTARRRLRTTDALAV